MRNRRIDWRIGSVFIVTKIVAEQDGCVPSSAGALDARTDAAMDNVKAGKFPAVV